MPKDVRERRKSRQADVDAEFEDCDTKLGPSPSSSSNMLQMTAELVPKFSGRDNTYPVARWIDDVECNAEIFGWTPLQQLLVARRALTGTAELWLRAERPFKSWDDLKAALMKEFPDTIDAKAIHELMSARKKGSKESCLDYMLTMKELGKRGKLPDYVAIKYIVEGIIDNEMNKVMLYGVTTYTELKEKLKIYEMIKRKMHDSENVDASTSDAHTSGRRIRCYGCGELGHASNDCPHKSKGLKCFRCNEFGHVGSTCTKTCQTNKQDRKLSGNFDKDRHSSEKETKRAMFGVNTKEANFTSDCSGRKEKKTNEVDVQVESDSDSDMSVRTEVMQIVDKQRKSFNKPIIPVKINGYCIKALVDSGSDVNLLSSNIYNVIGSPKCDKEKLILTGIGLSTVQSMGKCFLNLSVNQQCYDGVPFYVISSDCALYDVVLGQDFLANVTVVMEGGCVSFVCKEGPGFALGSMKQYEFQCLEEGESAKNEEEAPFHSKSDVKDPMVQQPCLSMKQRVKEDRREVRTTVEKTDAVIDALNRNRSTIASSSLDQNKEYITKGYFKKKKRESSLQFCKPDGIVTKPCSGMNG